MARLPSLSAGKERKKVQKDTENALKEAAERRDERAPPSRAAPRVGVGPAVPSS